MGEPCLVDLTFPKEHSFGFVPEQLVINIMFAAWAGFFCLFLVDLISRVAGAPIRYSTMIPFLIIGFAVFSLFGSSIVIVGFLESKPLSTQEMVLAGLSTFVSIVFMVDVFTFWIHWESRRQIESTIKRDPTKTSKVSNALIFDTV